MISVIIFIHTIVMISLVGAILLHSGRGTGLSSAFGGGIPSTLSGSTMIEKNLDRVTIVLAIIFGTTSILLARIT